MSSRRPTRSRNDKAHAAKPYDRPKDKGLVQKVKNLIPNWLGLPNWLVGSDEKTVNIVTNNDSSDEEDELNTQLNVDGESLLRETFLDTAGPSGYNTHLLGNSETVNRQCALIKEGVPSSSSFARGPIHRPPTSRNTSVSNPPVVNGDDQSDNSETSASTSGCSSLAPSHQEKRRACLTGLPISEAALDHIRMELSRKKGLTPDIQNEDEYRGSSSKALQQEKRDVAVSAEFSENEDNDTQSTKNSLWSEDEHINTSMASRASVKRVINSRPQPIGSSKRPCFNTSAFGAPISANTRQALFDGSLGLSPFYDGRTTFGGASAYRKARVNSQFPYKTEGSRVNVKERTNRECMSSTAKRILNTLERMSSPLQDAKKIPTESHSTEFALSFTPASYRRRQLRPEHKIYQSTLASKTLPTSSLATPMPINRGQNLQPLVQFDKRKSDSDFVKDSFSESSYASNKAGGKIRATTSQPKHFSTKPNVEDEIIEEPDLPQISLPITSLPTFNFKLPQIMTSTPALECAQTSKIIPNPLASRQPTTKSSATVSEPSGPFTFSTPIQPKSLPQILSWQRKSPFSTQKFSFSNPAPVITGLTTETEESIKDNTTTLNTSEEFMGFGDKFKPVIGSWECTICMLMNKASDEKCIACESPRVTAAPPSTVISSIAATSNVAVTGSFKGFGEKFKAAPGTWECPSCMIKNKQDDMKCVACETSKPGSSKSKPLEKHGFAGLIPPAPLGSWECDTCLVRNRDLSLTKCQACETPRASAVVATSSAAFNSGNTFKFGKSSNVTDSAASSTFKFGLPLSVSSSASTTSASVTTGFVFGTAANTSATPSVGGFKFGLPSQATIPNSSSTLDSVDKPSGFVFDPVVKAPIVTSSTLGFMFGDKTKVTPSDKPKTIELTIDKSGEPDKTVSSNELVTSVNAEVKADSVAKTDHVVVGSSAFVIPSQTISVVESTPVQNTTIINTTPSTTNASGTNFSFGFSQDAVKTTEIGAGTSLFGTSNTPKINALDNNSPAGFTFGSNLAASENKSVKLNVFENKIPAMTATVTSTSTLPTTGIQFSFGSLAQIDKGNSVTTTSLFNLKSDVQPNLAKSEPSQASNTPSTLFSFGTNSAISVTQSKNSAPTSLGGGFVFGSGLNKPATGASSAGFNFSANNTNTLGPPIPAFGTSMQQVPPVSLSTQNFSFGTPASEPKPKLSVSSVIPSHTSSSIFKFGANSGTETTTIGSQPQPAASLFSFGSNVAPGLGSAPNFSANPTFQFGNQAPDSNVFRFGASQAKTTGLPASTVTPSLGFGNIGMGVSAAPRAPAFGQAVETGFNFQAGSSTGFNFGNPSTTLPNLTPQLQFQATDKSFNGTAATSNRKIRKAVRRVNKTTK